MFVFFRSGGESSSGGGGPNGFDTDATTTGWVLSLRLGREGVRDWRTHVTRLDADDVPHPVADASSPCGRAGDSEIRQCRGAP